MIPFLSSVIPKNKGDPPSPVVSPLQKLEELATIDTEPLIVIRSVFPFDFFPTTLSVDRSKISIWNNKFFLSKQVTSILIKNIANVIIDTAFPFATIRIFDRYFADQELRVTHLWEHEATVTRRLIDGLLVADKEGIDLTAIPSRKLRMRLEQVGSTRARFAR